MKWLVAMECSGRVRDALRARGHDAWSCDFKACESDPRWHIQGDVFSHSLLWHREKGRRGARRGWDAMIAHPDCTFLTKAGARHMSIPWRAHMQRAAVEMVKALWSFPMQYIAIENPSGRLSTLWRPPDQMIQPYMFGHPEFKGTCLWLKDLPLLRSTQYLEPPAKDTDEFNRWSRVHWEGPGTIRGQDRKTRRSRTLQGIADAMADQWGDADQFKLVAA